MKSTGRISFQGWPGANSDMACRQVYPALAPMPCPSFEEALGAVRAGEADLAMIPIENSVAGRVADIHHLLPGSGLHIVGEHFQPIHHHLLAIPGTTLDQVRTVHSHVQALGQCRATIRTLGLEPVVHADTAGAAKMVAERGDRAIAAIANSLAGEIYGLETLKSGIEDEAWNTTRFVVMAPEARWARQGSECLTSFVFEVRSVPAALYKALGGFATNSINMTKLESYMIGGLFHQTRFWADVEGHPHDPRLRYAFEELEFFTKNFHLMGCYPAHPFRQDPSQLGTGD